MRINSYLMISMLIAIALLSSSLFSANAVAAQESQLPPPSPPPSEYPLLKNIDSYISKPFTINQTQASSLEFAVHNANNFTLYNVQIHNFNTAGIPLKLSNVETLDKLSPNETGTIHAMITTDHRFNTTGKSFMFWTILAENETKITMESTMYQRDMAVVVPEFGSLVIPVAAGSVVATVIGRTRIFRTRL